jgi:hypothetical protein
VLEAEHADAALLILNVQAADVHVLFTDIHMPGSMNGLALAHHAHRHFPWIALLVASGDARPGKKDLPEGCRFLAKPYDPGHAIASICELLRQPPLSGPFVPPWLAFSASEDQVYGVVGLAMRCSPSVDFCGYWQRARVA